MSSRRILLDYLGTAITARTATDAASSALLLVSVAILGTPAQGSALVAAVSATSALSGPFIGAALDRSPRRRLGFALSMVNLGVCLTALGLLIGRVPLAVLLPLGVLTGLSLPALTGAMSAQLPSLLPASALPRAYATDAGTYSMASIIGAPIASSLLLLAPRAPLFFPIISLTIALIFLIRLPLRSRTQPAARSMLNDLRRGLVVLWSKPTLRRNFIVTTPSIAGQAALFVCAPIIAQNLTGSLAATGFILGAMAIGGIVSTLVLIRTPVQHPDRMIVMATIFMGVGMVTAGWAPSMPIAMLGAFMLGAGNPAQLSASFLVRNRESGEELRAQVMTTFGSLRTTSFAAGTAVFGALSFLGVPIVIGLGSLLYIGSVGFGLLIRPGIEWRTR